MKAISGLRLPAALPFRPITSPSAAATISTAPVEGLRDASPRVHALVGARDANAPGQIIGNGAVVVRDGVIEAVGAGLAAPAMPASGTCASRRSAAPVRS
jgi:hypothetical protein